MDWFHGGLQFQLEHHLLPRLPRCQLRKVSAVVQDLCKKHNLPYRSYSFFKANICTIKTLRELALQARDLANPVPKNLVWPVGSCSYPWLKIVKFLFSNSSVSPRSRFHYRAYFEFFRYEINC
ncbi:Delta(8)-fatty-acid desaturase 1 [Linum perenne]